MTDTFWRLNAAGWSAVYSIATGAYALLTGTLAAVTFYGMRNQVKVAREAAVIQAKASSISNNRQQWINALRDEIAGFLTDIDTRVIVWNGQQNFTDDAKQALSASIRRHIYKVELLINPNEGESKDLLDRMKEAMEHGFQAEAEAELVKHTQSILKTEWERVKKGE